jgi:hypothetical protein
VDEANALLPRLEAAFVAMDGRRRELNRRVDRIKILDALWGEKVQEPENPDREEFLAERAGVRRVLQDIERVVDERILPLGVRFPQGGLEHGLVDFPTTYRGRMVFLCWKRGETEVTAWHEVDGGFRGRRPLTPEQAARMGREGDRN